MSGDLLALQGKWRVVSLEIDGVARPRETFANAEVHISGDQFTSLGMGAEYRGRVRVGERGSSKTMTLSFAVGPEAGRSNHGIYEIGRDEWRLCLNMNGDPAPAEFSTSPGSGCALQTMVRTP